MIDKISNTIVNDKVKSVYGFNDYSIQDLLSKFFEQINSVTDLVNQNEEKINTQNFKLEEFINYMKSEGIPPIVIETVTTMYNDGRLTELFNSLANNVIDKVEEFKTQVNSQLEQIETIRLHQIKQTIGYIKNGKLTSNQKQIIKNIYNIDKVTNRIFFSDIKKFGGINIPHRTLNGIDLTASNFDVVVDRQDNTYWGDTIDRTLKHLNTSEYTVIKSGSGVVLTITDINNKGYQCGYIDYTADLFNEGDELDYVCLQILLLTNKGETKIIPEGEYKLNKTLVICNRLDGEMTKIDGDNYYGTHITGQGIKTILKPTEIYNAIQISHIDYLNLENLTIIGNNRLNDGINLYAVGRSNISNIHIENCRIGFRTIYLCIFNVFNNITCTKNEYGYVGQRFINQNTFNSMKLIYNIERGLYMSGDFGNYNYTNSFTNLVMEGNGAFGTTHTVQEKKMYCGAEFINCRNFEFISPYFEGNGTACSDLSLKPSQVMFTDYVQDSGGKRNNFGFSFIGGLWSRPIYQATINSSEQIYFKDGYVEIENSWYTNNNITYGKSFLGDNVQGILLNKNIEIENFYIISEVFDISFSNYEGVKVKNCSPDNRIYTKSADGSTHILSSGDNIEAIVKCLDTDFKRNHVIKLGDGSYESFKINSFTKPLTITSTTDTKPIIKGCSLADCNNINISKINFSNNVGSGSVLFLADNTNLTLTNSIINCNNYNDITFGILCRFGTIANINNINFTNTHDCLTSDSVSRIFSYNNTSSSANTVSGLIAKNGGMIIREGTQPTCRDTNESYSNGGILINGGIFKKDL